MAISDTTWMDDAACRQDTDPEGYFVKRNQGLPDQVKRRRMSKAVCTTGCDVRTKCLLYAIENKIEIGIWGGLGPGERKSLVRQQREARKAAAVGA